MSYNHLGAVLGMALASTAPAAPTFFDTEAAFLAATAGGTLTLEDFENFNFSQTTSITTLPSGLNLSSSNSNFVDINIATLCAGTGSCVSFSTISGGTTVTFTFDSGLPNAFGVFLGDLGTATGFGTTLTLATSSGASQAFAIPASAQGDERYFGVIDTVGSVSATITNTESGDSVYIDNVRWGNDSPAVPVPATLALLGLGLAGLGWSRRKK